MFIDMFPNSAATATVHFIRQTDDNFGTYLKVKIKVYDPIK